MGTIPEAVWTEMVANINEVALAFNGVEMDGYKVAAYVAVPNSILEDASDVAAGQRDHRRAGARHRPCAG